MIGALAIYINFEREDWNTTNIGKVDHIIYILGLYDENGKGCWGEGKLNLKLFNTSGLLVYSVNRTITNDDLYKGTDHLSKTYIIWDYEIDGDITDVSTYNATFITQSGTVLYSNGIIKGAI